MSYGINSSVAHFLANCKGMMTQLDSLLPDELVHLPDTTDDDHAALLQDLFARIVWTRVAEPGEKCTGSLINLFGSVKALDYFLEDESGGTLYRRVKEASEDISIAQLQRSVARWRLKLSSAESVRDVTCATQSYVKVTIPSLADWPTNMSDLGDGMPKLLWFQGSRKLFSVAQVAVIGARAVTPYGSSITAELVERITDLDYAVVSGAAFGVDGIAHRTCLVLGKPTVAFLAGGIDRIYPAAHSELIRKIAYEGLICSESLAGTAPTRWRFLMRNRLIAAISQATLVTEAGLKSGSLNTAGHAAQLGREIGAVPGSVYSPASAGCHKLIREYGAELITGPETIADFLHVQAQDQIEECAKAPASHDGLGPRQLSIHGRVVDALPLRGARHQNEIAKHCGLSEREVLAVLAEMETLGTVGRSIDGRHWSLIRR